MGVGLIRTIEIAKKFYELARSYELVSKNFDEKIIFIQNSRLLVKTKTLISFQVSSEVYLKSRKYKKI